MDMVRFGRSIRALRLRRRWRQLDLAHAARVGRTVIARIERGLGDTVPLRKLETVAHALGARLDLRLSWNGEALDRVLDAAHARLVDVMVGRLRAVGWDVATEVTFMIRGERGSIDVLAWHAATRVLLLIEVKSVVPDIQAMLAALDRKVRLAPGIAHERGWTPAQVGMLLVIGASRTSRRRVESVAETFDATFPHRGSVVRRWIKAPSAEMALRGLLFLSFGQEVTTRHRASTKARSRAA